MDRVAWFTLHDLFTARELGHKSVRIRGHRRDTVFCEWRGRVPGKALFQMMGVFAEFERAIMRERVNARLERARAEGKKLGRPRVSHEVDQAIRDARTQGKGMLKIARDLEVDVPEVVLAGAADGDDLGHGARALGREETPGQTG